ncbi:hypothetical protein ATCV1_z175R [Acanthocystis turfacea chlorella virus 1]|uniref:Uncharacterized protein z175R n=1 Tax=Chlorovirus heliozoae TaxID=322019 RepID=A7K8D5_9PHYC|nr:hypothetical protein ATCV1_z175R [Acanthocystis turfacea chlorella virus 1]ABT16309.1 hypothetical protein ATCV1_z175R [Acanthocystis turfacea chlorella virus 1]
MWSPLYRYLVCRCLALRVVPRYVLNRLPPMCLAIANSYTAGTDRMSPFTLWRCPSSSAPCRDALGRRNGLHTVPLKTRL